MKSIFKKIRAKYPWNPIKNCPGRYILKGGPQKIPLADLIVQHVKIIEFQTPKARDIVLVAENPVRNFKVLYGTGHMKLDREAGKLTRVGGVSYTIKDGIVFDAKALLADVREMVAREAQREAQREAARQGSDGR